MAIVPLILFSIIIDFVYVGQSIKSESENLYSRSEVLTRQVVTSGYMNSQSDVTMELKLGELAQLINGRVMLVDSNLRVDYDSYNVDKGKVFLWENVTRSAKGEQLYSIDRDNDILTTTIPMTDVIESKDSNTANSVKIVGEGAFAG